MHLMPKLTDVETELEFEPILSALCCCPGGSPAGAGRRRCGAGPRMRAWAQGATANTQRKMSGLAWHGPEAIALSRAGRIQVPSRLD